MAQRRNTAEAESINPRTTDPESEPAKAAEPLTLGKVDYRPSPGVHIAEAGPVAESNWIGLVKGRRVVVHFGAQESKVHEGVRAAMAKSGVGFRPVSYAQLGLKAPPGAARVEVHPREVQHGANLLG